MDAAQKSRIFAVIFLIMYIPLVLTHAPPILFVYGDSTVDVGNNNDLTTIAKATRPPYGRDFDTHQPTGRFCNGRLSVDYLALYMGFSDFTLPYKPFLTTEFLRITRALNFASAGAGILKESGADLGEHIPMDEQVRNLRMVASQQAYHDGDVLVKAVLAQSVHYVSVGSNDFIHNYLQDIPQLAEKMKHYEFISIMTQSAFNVLEGLYATGARKIAMTGIGPLGCTPHYLHATNTTKDGCVGSINFMVQEFNDALEATIGSIRKKHKDLHIVYCDVFGTMMSLIEKPYDYGFESARVACCGIGHYGGGFMCVDPSMACNEASKYVWWDMYHPTDGVNSIVADANWSGNACRPFSVQQLAHTYT